MLQAFRACLSCLVLLITAVPSAAQVPPTPKQTATETYHGEKVVESYRWLEDWSQPAVKKWNQVQSRYARSYLEGLPNVAAIRRRVTEIMKSPMTGIGNVEFRAGQYFILIHQPPRQQPYLVVTPSLADRKHVKVVVDPNKLDPSGKTSIDWFKPSPDGKLVAISLSKAGTERGDLSVYRTNGQRAFEIIPYVNSGTAGGDLAWAASGDGFFYTRHFKVDSKNPSDHNVYQQLFYHKLKTPMSADRYELGEGFPQIAEIQLDVDHRSGRLLATVQKGDGGEFAHYLRSANGGWRTFSKFGDKIVQAVFGRGDDLYVVSQQDAPRGKLIRINAERLDLKNAETVIPEGQDTIVSSGIAFWGETTVLPTKDRLYVVYQLGGPSEIRAFDLKGKPLEKPSQLEVSAVHGLLAGANDELVFANNSFVEPNGLYVYNPQSQKTQPTAFRSESPVDLSDVQVVREFATSKDGTKIPINIIAPKGIRLDGSNPCVVYGYGGYGVNITPRFRATTKLLTEQGVIYAVANIRGGGEYGEQWHREGNLTRKQNVFDDFAAAIQYMIDRGYSSPKRMGIMGGSNGGLLMGATLTQHPELVSAVVSSVGIYDMLRVELSPNGKFNITEFGTVTNPEHFRALYAYSPYHNVKDKTDYPATLFLTGENDPRVDPMQSRKMTARLQAATSSKAPILLRTSSETGHGNNSSLNAKIAEYVDIYAFFFRHLGVQYKSPR